jgi:uncharacterized membrane protein YccC
MDNESRGAVVPLKNGMTQNQNNGNVRSKSWKTTLGGILGAVGTVLAAAGAATGVPLLLPIGAALTALGHLLTGGSARDHVVTDEAAGLK